MNENTRRSKQWYWKNRKKSIRAVLRHRKVLLSNGKCAICGKVRQQVDKIRCDSCLKIANERQKKLRQEKRELNECLRCTNTAKDGFNHCEIHLEKLRGQKRCQKSNSF